MRQNYDSDRKMDVKNEYVKHAPALVDRIISETKVTVGKNRFHTKVEFPRWFIKSIRRPYQSSSLPGLKD